jgi:ubiquinone/menaquinone biosynthesis C-methylase UbiE
VNAVSIVVLPFTNLSDAREQQYFADGITEGSGLNLRFYSRAVDRVCGVDLSPELVRLTHERTADAVVPMSLIRASAEHLPFADAVFDTVVMTWTLCSIANPVAALIEMRRVLKPGGQLLFVEHGLSPEIWIARWPALSG